MERRRFRGRQPNPCLTAVIRPKDAGSSHGVAVKVALAGSNVEDLCIRWIVGNRP